MSFLLPFISCSGCRCSNVKVTPFILYYYNTDPRHIYLCTNCRRRRDFKKWLPAKFKVKKLNLVKPTGEQTYGNGGKVWDQNEMEEPYAVLIDTEEDND